MEQNKDIKFTDIYELYNHVRPALRSKLKAMIREKYDYIKEEDIWNYLVKNKWSKDNGLVLCDVVDDILHVENDKIDDFVKNERQKKQEEILVEDLEIL